MRRFLMILTLLLIVNDIFSIKLDIKVDGEFNNQRLYLLKISNYISYSYDIVDSKLTKDNIVSFDINVNNISDYYIKIKDYIAKIYLSPNIDYNVYFNVMDNVNKDKFVYNDAVLLYKNLDSNDVNNLIINFDNRLNNFIYENKLLFNSKLFKTKLEDFKKEIKRKYSNINNTYFKRYITYNIANIELAVPQKYTKLNNYTIFHTYLDKEFYPKEISFMWFFEKYYKNQLHDFTNKDIIYDAIYNELSIDSLSNIMNKDFIFKNKNYLYLAQLQYINSLFYSSNYKSILLEKVIQISQKTDDTDIKDICKSIIKDFELNLNSFSLEGFTDSNNSYIENIFTERKYEHTYIIFWSVKSMLSINELNVLEKLAYKYKDNTRFLAVNVDYEKADFINFAKNNFKNLEFYHIIDNFELIRKYKVETFPYYLLIDNDNTIMNIGNLSSIPNNSGVSLDFELHKLYSKD